MLGRLSWSGAHVPHFEIAQPNRAQSWAHPGSSWVQSQMDAFKTGQSISGGVFILGNVTVALALLNMPYAFKLVGRMMILVMLFIGAIATYTAYLIHKSLELTRSLVEPGLDAKECCDWGYLAEVAFGKRGRLIAQFSFRGELVAYILSFLCTLGVHVHLLCPTVSIEQGVIMFSIATFAMSYLPPLWISKVALCAHIAYVFVVVCLYWSEYAALTQPDAPEVMELVRNNWAKVEIVDSLPNIPTVVEICVYAWAGHAVVPTIAGSLVRRSDVRHVIFITYPIAIGLAMAIGLSGYLILGPHTKQVFTENLGKAYWLSSEGGLMEDLSWMRVLAAISVTIKLGATVPCLMHPLLLSTEVGIRSCIFRGIWRAFVSLAMAAVACIFRERVVIAVALAGATFGNVLVLILPCTVYYGIKRQVEKVGYGETSMLAAITGLGCLLMVYSTYDCMKELLKE